MPVTLAQAKLDAQDDIQAGIIDEYAKSSFLLGAMPFDDAVSPGTSGATLTYGYTRLATQRAAAARAINSEYTPAEVTKTRHTVELKPFGGSYQIDRVVAKVGRALVDEVALQASQLVKAASAYFHDTAINGDSGTDANAFDGLDVALAGSDTEFSADAVVDVRGATIGANSTEAHDALDVIDEWLSLLNGTPDMILGNAKAIARLRSLARRAGYFSQSRDDFGRTVESYNGIQFMDAGAKAGTNDPIVPIATRTVGGTPTDGLTDLYAVRLGLDGFHGVSLAGDNLVNQWLPDFNSAGAVKTGEVEMVAAVALKATKAASVLRNVRVQ